jgi:acetyl/propionyl-CoA carboxylase alpha subunit
MRGTTIGLQFDPMLSKLICYAESREQCIDRLSRALRDYVVLGTRTNISWLRRVVSHPAFREGLVSTRFIEDHADTLQPHVPPVIPLIAAALAAAPRAREAVAGEAKLPSVWESLGGWGR